jgi:integrase
VSGPTAVALLAVPAAFPSGAGLLERLVGVVRPPFRADVLVLDAADPVFGGSACLVTDCVRTARSRGLCQGHHLRWAAAGRPDLATFAVSTDPRWHRQQPNASCRVEGCGYGVARGGMCQLHYQKWDRSGRPDLDNWLPDPPRIKQPAPGADCALPGCSLWPQAAGPFCHAHAATWRANGRPSVQEFLVRFHEVTLTEDQIIRLDRLGGQLKLEVQYALQRRADQRTTKTPPAVVMQVVRLLATTGAASLLQACEAEWAAAMPHSNARALLLFARRQVADLAEAGGWEAEFDRDVWQMRRLGFDGNQTLAFTAIPQPWLRLLVKRWLRWRLSTGVGLEVARRGLRALTRLAAFLDRAGVDALADLDRPVLERFLADLHAELAGRQRHGDQIGQINSFLTAVRTHHWDDTLPAAALVFSDDYPQRTERLPRALAEHVMAQVEHPDTLARFPDPAHRLVTLILIRTGLRVSDALGLDRDCVVTDPDGGAYLRYLNHKMNRQALVPIDDELHTLITVHAARAAGTSLLFPRPTKNPDGRAPISSSTYRLVLYRWLEACDVRDEHGRPVHLTPHQWRHTLGTRLINRDVPQEVVRRILDHDSPQMTGHYARLHETTIRRHWEAARTVDATGRHVHLDPDGPLAEAAWARHHLDKASQALPNGACALPVQNTCPHANACLTCPMFLTSAEFLPVHCAHRDQVAQLLATATAHGQARLVEMNQQVLGNLEQIIAALHAEPHATSAEVADAR